MSKWLLQLLSVYVSAIITSDLTDYDKVFDVNFKTKCSVTSIFLKDLMEGCQIRFSQNFVILSQSSLSTYSILPSNSYINLFIKDKKNAKWSIISQVSAARSK